MGVTHWDEVMGGGGWRVGKEGREPEGKKTFWGEKGWKCGIARGAAVTEEKQCDAGFAAMEWVWGGMAGTDKGAHAVVTLIIIKQFIIIYKAQNLVCMDYTKHIHVSSCTRTHTRTHTPTHPQAPPHC